MLGNTFDQLDEITNEIFEGFGEFELGVGDADLEALISGIFSSMAGWFDNMFLAFDFDTIASLVDTAVAGASAGVQGYVRVSCIDT